MDVALPRITKAMRVRPLVQISREGSIVNTATPNFIRSRRFKALGKFKIHSLSNNSFRVDRSPGECWPFKLCLSRLLENEGKIKICEN